MAAASSSSTPTTSSYFCYNCERLYRMWIPDPPLICFSCQSLFIERIDTDSSTFMSRIQSSRLHKRNVNTANSLAATALISDLLINSGFHHLIEHINGPDKKMLARKAAVDSMPFISITESHVDVGSKCLVCMELFELDSGAHEMPCKHIFHRECILMWFDEKNSCPICRQEVSVNPVNYKIVGSIEDPMIGYTLRNAPDGGFTIGTIKGARGREMIRDLPFVYSMDVKKTGKKHQAGVLGSVRRILFAIRSFRFRSCRT